MNILFFCEDAVIYKAGGVQNVTALWYNYFLRKGYGAYIVYRKNDTNSSPDIPQTQLPFKTHLKSYRNIDFLIQFIKKNDINIVINQAAQGPLASYVCIRACKRTQTPLISIVHNSPDALFKRLLSHRLFSINRYIKSAASFILPFIIRRLPLYGTDKLVRYSTKLVLLAPEYIQEYEDLYIGHHSEKLVALPNPINSSDADTTKTEKGNIALFVGRLCEQKGVERLLKIWKNIELSCPDVKLYIIGDGELDSKLKTLSKELKLEHVYFEGKKDPIPYYERSKVFLMTSIYEGLPLTLLECQQYGAVPVVMDSFSAAKGILGEDLKQFIIPPNEENTFCREVIELLKNERAYEKASLLCINNIKRFSLEAIAPEFEKIIIQSIKTNSKLI